MSRPIDISDSTDWLTTSIPELGPLDASLRCQVCKDFYNTPVITTCAHTFCSLCIRRCLASDGKCPICRASEQEVKLRRNGTVEEIVESFLQARPRVLERGRRSRATEEVNGVKSRTKKRKALDADLDDAVEGGSRQRRTPSGQPQTGANDALEDDVMIIEDVEETDFELDDGLVACPMCNRRMKEEEVFPHLDRCEGDASESSRRTTRSQSRTVMSATTAQRTKPQQPVKPADRLPQLNYSLLKDNALRKKLQELGIPTSGPRPLLIRRHTEWMNLWNANCDSSRPRDLRELLRELDVWERSQGGLASNGGALNGSTAAVMKRDFDGQRWAQSNKDDFDKLITDARRKRGTASVEQAGAQETELLGRNGAEKQAIRREGKQMSTEARVTAQTAKRRMYEAYLTDQADQAEFNTPQRDQPCPDFPRHRNEELFQPSRNTQYAFDDKEDDQGYIPEDDEDPIPRLGQGSPKSDSLQTTPTPPVTGLQLNCTLNPYEPGSKIKKVPMFELSKERIRDVGSGAGAH